MSSPLVQFYEGRCVFVTGGTGFVGRVFVEKLLRSCPGISAIYLLLRAKPGGQVEDRLKDIIDIPVFDELKREKPQLLTKLIPISGDVTLPGLGMALADLEILREKVSVVFHLAARIKFDRNLKEAVDINVKGARRILELCRQLPRLKAFVHVSTCYIHLDHKELHEKIYLPPIMPQTLIDSTETMSPTQLEALVDKLLVKCPNVYACTKAVTEYLLAEECGEVPLVIVRPSIVTASSKDPVPGWIDNFFGPTGFIAGCMTAFLRTSCINPDVVGDMIPVDYSVNLMISAAWHKAVTRSPSISVYNCSTGMLNPITWGRFQKDALKLVRQYPSETLMWYPDFSVGASGFTYKLEIWIYHYIPAYFFDTIARLSGRRPKMVRMYDKTHRALSCLDFYVVNQWNFHTNNMIKLIDEMNPDDKTLFNFDVRTLDWPSYQKVFHLGIRKFLLKEDLSTVPAATRKMKMFYWIRIVFHLLLLAALVWFFIWMFRGFALPATDLSILNPML